MKKGILITVIIVCIVVFLSTAIAGAMLTARTIGWNELTSINRFVSWSNDFPFNFPGITRLPGINIAGTEKFEIDQTEILTSEEWEKISMINLTALSEQINVTTKGDQIEASLKGSYRSSSELIWEVIKNGNQLDIRIKYPKLGYQGGNLIIDLIIPDDYIDKISINTLSGNCYVQGNTTKSWESFMYEGLSAELTIDNANAEKINLSTLSGNLILNNITGSVEANSLSGNVNLLYDQNTKTRVETLSGNIVVTGNTNESVDVVFETMSGNMRLNDHTFVMKSQEKKKTNGILFEGTSSNETWNFETMSGDLIFK